MACSLFIKHEIRVFFGSTQTQLLAPASHLVQATKLGVCLLGTVDRAVGPRIPGLGGSSKGREDLQIFWKICKYSKLHARKGWLFLEHRDMEDSSGAQKL